MTPEQNRTITRAILIFGCKNQTMQTIEELMELQHALFENVHRGTNNRGNIVEEVADVEIMLTQIKQIYGISEHELDTIKNHKIKRLDTTIQKFVAKKPENQPKNSVQIDRTTSNGIA